MTTSNDRRVRVSTVSSPITRGVRLFLPLRFVLLAFLALLMFPDHSGTIRNPSSSLSLFEWVSARFPGGPVASAGEEQTGIDQPAERETIEPGDASSILETRGLPIRPRHIDSKFQALRAWAWKEGEVFRIYLEGWVRIRIGSYSFTCDRAAVWTNKREGVMPGTGDDSPPQRAVINEIAVYLEGVSPSDQASGVSFSGANLLITSATIGDVELVSDSFSEGRPGAAETATLRNADVRFVNWIRQKLQEGAKAEQSDRVVIDVPPRENRAPINYPALDDYLRRGTRPAGANPPIIPEGANEPRPHVGTGQQIPTGQTPGRTGYWTGGLQQSPFGATIRPQATIFFRGDDLQYQFSQDGSEGFATLRGDLVVQYAEAERRPGEAQPRQLTLSADRAVLFTDPISYDDIQMQRVDAEVVRGVYLEGNVIATDGQYTLRGPRMYYEFLTNRAIVLDAVFHTYNREARVPVYARADEIRQVAQQNWEADDVIISTSEFFTPVVSLGAGHVTIRRSQDETTGEIRNDVTVRNATVNLGDTSVFWWPGYRGAAEDLPIRKVSLGGNENDGVTLRTEWNLFGLLGKERPGNTDFSLLFDYYEKRGPAVGLDGEYQTRNGRGRLTSYFIQDDGIDKLSSGKEIERHDESRGMITGWHREELDDHWTVLLEGAYFSDVAFMDAFFEDMTEDHREYQTRAALRYQEDNSQFEIFGKYALNNFIVNQDLLQSQTYQVEKLPEVGYYRFADELFRGRVSYSSEYRLSRMRLIFPDHTLAEIGQGRRAFDLPASTNLRDYFVSLGRRETFVDRFFTRHELSMPINLGPFKIVPFAMGRFAFYDEDEPIEAGDPDAETEWWMLSGGVRISTQIARVDNAVDNRMLDLHRMRHIIEPSLVLWHGESNADGMDYPVYDLDVEGASIGSVAKFGVRNTWQTQRGGPGRWRSVDVLVVNTNVVFTGSETNADSEIPRFFDFRPEYSRLGDHLQGDFKWLVSDSLAVAGDTVLNFDTGDIARGNVGFRIDHSTNLFSFADYRHYEFNDDNLINFGLGYRLTPTYNVRFISNYDLDQDEMRSLNVTLNKRTPQFDIALAAQYNNQRDETTIGIVLAPKGTGGTTYGGILNPRDDRSR